MSNIEDKELNNVTKELRGLHLERYRISKKEKVLLRELVENRRRRKDIRRLSEESEKTTDAVGASKSRLANEKKDRFGKVIRVGDRVEFLTSGRFVGNFWTVYKITDKRVLCERNNGFQKTHREFKNVKRLD